LRTTAVMRVSATDAYDYYRPSKCRLRVCLRHHDVEEAPPGPFEELLRTLGKGHKGWHLAHLAVVVLSEPHFENRPRRTM
jgi:hypothetical protein